MKRREVNPSSWQEQFGFQQGIEVTSAELVLYCAGQISIDSEGNPVPGDMAAQAAQAFDNLEAVLEGAGMTLANIVRLNYYVTSVEQFREAGQQIRTRLASGGCRPTSTLLEVAGLARPEYLIEIEATAVA